MSGSGVRMGINYQGYKRNKMFYYLSCGSGNMAIYSCQNTSNCILIMSMCY